ncbi:MAG: hypothetical protein K2P57_13420 [Burkholderiales bacterium]|nr:hypothetical protein [Burkholderiales bacterium]
MSEPKGRWSLYEAQPSFVLGFHGCDKSVAEKILSGETRHLTASKNDYDWLGNGIYFWESNPQRADDFANEAANGGKNSRGKIKTPYVIGAVIDLGRCLNLIDSAALEQVAFGYELLSMIQSPLPTNGQNLKARRLDCAAIQTLHYYRDHKDLLHYDTVRGVFWEGEELYPGAGFSEKNHIQICVRNTGCIKGYFRPIEHPL